MVNKVLPAWNIHFKLLMKYVGKVMYYTQRSTVSIECKF